MTYSGRLFHTTDAATGNDQSPTVVWRVWWMTSIDDDAERSLHRARESAGRLSSSVWYGGIEAQTHVQIWTPVLRVWSQSVPLHSASEVDGGAEWCDLTSTMSKLVEQLHSSLTEAAKEDVEEYRPVSRYRSPDDWGQVTSPVTEPRVSTLDGKWNEAASAQRNMLTLSSWHRNSSTSPSPDEFLGLGHTLCWWANRFIKTIINQNNFKLKLLTEA